MKKSQIRFISMCLAVKHFYDKYKTELDSDAVIARLFQEFMADKAILDVTVQIQSGYTTQAAKQKQIEEDEMIQATVRFAAKGYVYAVEKKLPGLIEIFDVSACNLQNMSDVKLHAKCLTVHEALGNIDPEAIAEYGVTADDNVQLKKEIDDFGSFISLPRSGIITRSQATAKIGEMVKTMRVLFKERLDKMIYSLPDSMQVLKNEYRAARAILSAKGGDSDDSNDETNVA